MDAARLLVGADNTTAEMTLGSNLCTGPQNCVFQDRLPSHAAISPHDCAATYLRSSIDNRTGGYSLGPTGHFQVTGLPMFFRDHPMHFEILGARTNVEPLPVIENNSANLAAGTDPISDDRNKRDFSIRWDPLENPRIPNRNVGEVVIAGHAISVRDIDHLAIAKGDRGGKTGITQR